LITKGKPEDLSSEEKDARNLEDVFLARTGKALRDYA